MKKYYYGIGLLFFALLLFSSCMKDPENEIPYVDEGHNTRRHIASISWFDVGESQSHEERYDNTGYYWDTTYYSGNMYNGHNRLILRWDKDLLRTIGLFSASSDRYYDDDIDFDHPNWQWRFEYDENTGRVISLYQEIRLGYIPSEEDALGFYFEYTDTLLTGIYGKHYPPSPYDPSCDTGYFPPGVTPTERPLLWKFNYDSEGLLSSVETNPLGLYNVFLYDGGPSGSGYFNVSSTMYFTWENGNIIRVEENFGVHDRYNYDEFGGEVNCDFSEMVELSYNNKASSMESLALFLFRFLFLSLYGGCYSIVDGYDGGDIVNTRMASIASAFSRNQVTGWEYNWSDSGDYRYRNNVDASTSITAYNDLLKRSYSADIVYEGTNPISCVMNSEVNYNYNTTKTYIDNSGTYRRYFVYLWSKSISSNTFVYYTDGTGIWRAPQEGK